MHRRAARIASCVVACVFSVTVAAQGRPDFSGQWIVEASTAPLSTGGPASRPDQGRLAVGDMGSGWAPRLTIGQDGKQLVIAETVFSSYDAAQQPRSVYALDGSETRNDVMLSHTTQTRVSRTQWDGQALRITTTYPGQDPATGKSIATEVVHRLLRESPTTLIVEATRSASLGGSPTTTRTIYRLGGK